MKKELNVLKELRNSLKKFSFEEKGKKMEEYKKPLSFKDIKKTKIISIYITISYSIQ